MQESEVKYQSGHKFGKLELVDKEIFYISFNTRDNQIIVTIPCIKSNIPKQSNPNSIMKNTMMIRSILIANFNSFHTMITATIPMRKKAHSGMVVPNISICFSQFQYLCIMI